MVKSVSPAPLWRLARPPVVAAAAVALGLGVAACGSGSTGASNPATGVPANAWFYVHANLKPGGDQGTQLNRLTGKILHTKTPGAELTRLLDSAGSNPNVRFSRDIKPWLGHDVAAFAGHVRAAQAGSPDAAALLSATDTGKAQAALPKLIRGGHQASYRGVSYRVNSRNNAGAVIGDWVVLGNPGGVRDAIDVNQGAKALDATQLYQQGRSAAGDNGFSDFFVNYRGLFDQALATQGNQPGIGVARDAIDSALPKLTAGVVSASQPGFVADFTTLGVKRTGAAPGNAAAALGNAPASAWLAIGIGNLGGKIQGSLQQLGQTGGIVGIGLQELERQLQQRTGLNLQSDLLSWMGDSALWVRGTTKRSIDGALVVHSNNPAATANAVAKLGRLAAGSNSTSSRVGSLRARGVKEGFSVRSSSSSTPEFDVAAAGDKMVIAVRRSALGAATGGGATLSSTPAFRSAAGTLGGLAPTFYFDLRPVLALARNSGAGSSPSFGIAMSYLRSLSTIIAGGKTQGSTSHERLVVAVH